MAKTKFTIDLGTAKLTDDQKKKLVAAAHKAVKSKLPKPKTGSKPPKSVTRVIGLAAPPPPKTVDITIDVKFMSAKPGQSEYNAKVGSQSDQLTSSGVIQFKKVPAGSFMDTDGNSLGKTIVTISTSTDPATPVTFQPGSFIQSYEIV